MSYPVTLIPGDGTGPEITDAVVTALEATGVKFDWKIENAGTDVYEEQGTPLPEAVIESIRDTKVGIKGPITTPVGTGFRSVNVALRKELDLFACVRPCKSYKGVRSRYESIDLIVVRENHEDLYAGIEFERNSEDGRELRAWMADHKHKIRDDAGISIKPISVYGTQRIVQFAFDYARKLGRKKVTSVHKANIMKYTDGLWLEVSREVAAKNTDIEFEDRIVDNMCMQLVMYPERYDCIVTTNLFGDILSDLAAGLVGGLGVVGGANIGDEYAVFEAVHGSAPDIAGKGIANPTAVIQSAELMLRHLHEDRAADAVRGALEATFEQGKTLTGDLGGSAGTREFADAVADKVTSILNDRA